MYEASLMLQLREFSGTGWRGRGKPVSHPTAARLSDKHCTLAPDVERGILASLPFTHSNKFSSFSSSSRSTRDIFTTAMISIIHTLAAANFGIGIWYALVYAQSIFPQGVIPDALRDIGWKKYMTFWNMCVQAVYFTICLLNDVAGTNEVHPKKTPLVRKIKDYMLCSIGFPLAMFVGMTFWGLYAVDRELVFPKALDPYFPTWLNHVMHTNIMVFTVLEIILSFRKYPSRNNGLGGLTAFMVVYLVWTFIIYFYSGAWVYPVLEVLNWGQRVIFFLGLLLFVNALYFMGEFLNNIIWAKELKQVQTGLGRRKKVED